MKKWLKIILIVIGILVGIVVLDTLQARIFKSSPIISWKQKIAGGYVDKGILMDTYYCSKNQDIETISWHFKTSKFVCPINNVNVNEKLFTKLKGTWIADGTQVKNILRMEDGKPIYADDYSVPYKLTFDNLGNYKIVTAQNKYVGKYEFNGTNLTLFDEKDLMKDRCELKSLNELACEYYAESFMKN